MFWHARKGEAVESRLDDQGGPARRTFVVGEHAVDPVCNMVVQPGATQGGSYVHSGETVWFCSEKCRDSFVKGPATYFTATDVVCGMTVDKHAPAAFSAYAGRMWFFCRVQCRDRFLAEPGSYLPAAAKARLTPSGAVWTCPMHPQVREPRPGPCPICGMALEPEHPALGTGPNPELVDMRRRFRVGLVFSTPLLVLAMGDMVPGLGHWLHAAWAPWAQLVLSLPVVLWVGLPFFERGWRSVLSLYFNMFTLIALGTGAAFLFSVVATVAPSLIPEAFSGHGGRPALYFDSAAMIVTLVAMGQVLELRARAQTSEAIRGLLELAPKRAIRVRPDGVDEEVALDQLAVGDHLRVRPGDHVPVDGVVLSGKSAINEAMMTGESMPVEKTAGARVVGGTGNGSGSFVMRAERVGRDTVLAQIVERVAEAQRSRAPLQKLADRVALYFVPAVVAAAVLSAVAWGVWGPEPRLAYALVNAVAVLIIACPCALGLATPISVVIGLGRGAQSGVLIRNAEALELLAKVDTLLVDKTGTLTVGRPSVVTIRPLGDESEEQLLRLAAVVERGSEHPVASAIVDAARLRHLPMPEARSFASSTGKGVTATVDGHQVAVGNTALLDSLQVASGRARDAVEELSAQGMTAIFVSIDGYVAGVLGVEDPVKSTTPEALAALRADGVRVVMVTGDQRSTAQAVARRLGIEEVHAEVLPDQKIALVQQLQAQGRRVAMAGDGVNDAPALAAATVGIAMGNGTDIAKESASVTLVKGDLRGIARARALSRATVRNIRQNLWWAFIYNTVGVPVAAGILFPICGLLLSPMIAAAAMSLSSVSVILNALRLRTVPL